MKNTTRLLVHCILVILAIVCIIIVAHEDRSRNDASVSGSTAAATETPVVTISPVPPVSYPEPTPSEEPVPDPTPAPVVTEIPATPESVPAQNGGGGLFDLLFRPDGGQS